MRPFNVLVSSRSTVRRCVVALTLVGLVAIPVTSAAQSRSSTDVQRDLDAAQEQADRLDSELGAVRGEISAAEAELAEIAMRLEDARGRLEAAEGQVVLAEAALVEAEDVQADADAAHVRAEDVLARTEAELAVEEATLIDQVIESFKYGTVGATRGAMVLEVLRRAEDPNAFAVGMKQLEVVVDTQESTVERVFELREKRRDQADDAARTRSRAVQAANDAAATLEVVEDLREQAAVLAAEVAEQEERQRVLLASLRVDEAETEALFQRVSARQGELESELAERRAQEEAERRAKEEAERRAKEEAARRARAGSAGGGGGGGGGGPDVSGGYCPVAGARAGRDFINDWGFPRSGGRSHQGNDVFASKGTPIVAITSGTVIRINPPSSPTALGGITVTYKTGDGSEWYNAHLDTIASGIEIGTSVAAGEQIGTVGNTGNARTTPPHLHIGRRYGGGWVNPWPTISQLC